MFFGSMASASDMLRAKFCLKLTPSARLISPSSAPQKTTSMPRSRTPASSRIGARGVPAQLALPIPPLKNGRPVLPEHSIVDVTSWRGRDLMLSSFSAVGLLTRPSISSAQVVASTTGRLKWAIEKKLVVGRYPGIKVLPDELVLDDLRNRV